MANATMTITERGAYIGHWRARSDLVYRVVDIDIPQESGVLGSVMTNRTYLYRVVEVCEDGSRLAEDSTRPRKRWHRLRMTHSVGILGGGIGGLSAAHELVERGFRVDVYEKRSVFGGKARSVAVPDSAADGNEPLPGEHGFRFFPAFYRHIFDTMRRIPHADNEEGVFDNLQTTTKWMIARRGTEEVSIPLELPQMIDEWETMLDHLVANPIGIPDEERQYFIGRLLTFLSASEARRKQELEHLSWWEFIDAEDKSEEYQQFYGVGVTRGLVATQAEKSSTRTVGRIYLQLLLGIAMPWLDVDRLLDGPTNDVWIDPWVEYLQGEGVTFHPETTVEHIACRDGRIVGVDVATEGERERVTSDFYIAAVPAEVMSELVTDPIADAAPSLADIDRLETAWMNGIQFYLDEDVPMTHGHTIYQGSPWALTSISQQQFWERDLSMYGNGEVNGILSLCISDWTREGTTVEKPAKDCTPEEIKREVWAQLTTWLNDGEEDVLSEDNIVEWFLDPDIEYPSPNETTNAEPLLINTVGSLEYRPEATLEIPNLYLAADYVQTNTDLATMEAANEAARRAVNGILDAVGDDGDRCEIWDLEEPDVFAPMKAYDRMRFNMDKPQQEL